MKYRLEIPFKLPSLNEYINKINSSYYVGNQFKKKIENEIILEIRRARNKYKTLPKDTIDKPVKLKVYWYEDNKKRDLDNIASSKKFIQDALVRAGVLKNDSQKYIVGYEKDEFFCGKEFTDRVIVEIEEI